jgi:hypothetical protein
MVILNGNSDNSKCLIKCVMVIIFIYFIYKIFFSETSYDDIIIKKNKKKCGIEKFGELNNTEDEQEMEEYLEESTLNENENEEEDDILNEEEALNEDHDGNFNESNTVIPSSILKKGQPVNMEQNIKKKLRSRNTTVQGYKHIDYSKGNRLQDSPSEWDQEFNYNLESSKGNDKFTPMDESTNLAPYKQISENKTKNPEDLFNVTKLLPNETKDDWFEVMPEPISVKNRHLINVTRPVGVNTIGTSLRNASWDIRGSPPCPKFVASPWLQSSIEPDTNIKAIV